MKGLLAAILLVLVLMYVSAFTSLNLRIPKLNPKWKSASVCVEGVTYLYLKTDFWGAGFTPKYGPDGKILTCKE